MSWLPRPLRGFSLPVLRIVRPDADAPAAQPDRRTLRIYFIKPAKYGDDGSVLAYRWGVIPNNTLTVLAALNDDYARAHPGVDVQTVLWDELVGGVLSSATIASICARARAERVELLIGLAGVHTSQYPRARDIGLEFRRHGVHVLIGGFHVSGHAKSVDFLTGAGVTVVIGEAENTWARLLDDYLDDRLQSVYRVTQGVRAKTGLDDIIVPLIREAALPAVSERYLQYFFNPTLTTIETSRGCPFACSYCAVKNVVGRTMRPRDPQRVVDWIRAAHDHHRIRSFFLVDDDLFRSPTWEAVLSGMAALRREGRDVWFMMQADVESALGEASGTRRSRSERFVELAAAAGCYGVFMGFESFNAANLEHTAKYHNEAREDRRRGADARAAATERVQRRYSAAVETWHRAGIGVHSGYMIGLPFDDRGCGREAAERLRDIGVDLASFFAYTPLPGTEDWMRAEAEGAIVDRDFDHYDGQHFVMAHPRLSEAELSREYRDAYRYFYSWGRLSWSLATVHRAAGLSWASRLGMLAQQLYFTYATRRGWHPMGGGIWRLRDCSAQRSVVSDDEAAAHYLGQVVDTPTGACSTRASDTMSPALHPAV